VGHGDAAWVPLVIGLALIVAQPAVGKVPLSTTVVWMDGSGATGELQFQGVADGGALRGFLEGGSETLRVTGTVSDTAEVAGSVKTLGGAVVGTFAGSLDDGALIGEVTIDSEVIDWGAPSDAGVAAEAP
jgi:hypothetical protein